MPRRRVVIATGEIYHIFNRSVGRTPIFIRTRDCRRALDVLDFYKHNKPQLKFSRYNLLPVEQKAAFMTNLKANNPKIVDIFAFCLMPNHFHFLIKEEAPIGISRFMGNFQNSYAKYFNTKTERAGALFQSMFKAVRIETDEQFLHVCRYIHLNPLTSYLIKNTEELNYFPWSSWVEYNRGDGEVVNTSLVLSHFQSLAKFRAFTFDQLDYQRRLEEIKHMVLE